MNAEQRAWAKALKELLLEIKSAVGRAREAGAKRLAAEEQAGLSRRYDGLVRQGLAINPPVGVRTEPHAPATAADEGEEGAGCQ